MRVCLRSTICPSCARLIFAAIPRLPTAALANLPDRFPKLEAVLLLFNNFTDGALDHVARFSNLRSLDLRGCVKISNAGIQKLLPLENLEELKFGPSQANDEVSKSLAQFKKLKTLMVEDTRLTNAGMPPLALLTNLEELSLLRTRISDDGLAALENLTKLGRLDLRDTLVHGPGLVHLKKITGLRVLSLSESPVGDTGLEVLERFRISNGLSCSEPTFPMLPWGTSQGCRN